MSASEAYTVAANLMVKSNVAETLSGAIRDFEELDKAINTARESLGKVGRAADQSARATATAADRAAAAQEKAADKAFQALYRAAEKENEARDKAADKQAAAMARVAESQEKAADRAYQAMYAAAERENTARDAAAEKQIAAMDRVAAAQEKAADRAYQAMYAAAERENELRDRQAANYERSNAEYENRAYNRGKMGVRGEVSAMDVNIASQQAEEFGKGLVERGAHAAFEPRYFEYMLTTDNRISPERAHEAYNAAFDATNSAPGSTPGGNMEALYDITNVTGDIKEAQEALPQFARLSAVMRAATLHSTGSDDPAYAAAKALEVLGKMTKDVKDPKTGKISHEVDIAQLNKYTEAMARVDVQTGGKVGPEDYLKYAAMGRVGALNMDDRFTFGQLPALLQVIKGPKTGTAINSASQIFEGGHETEKTMAAMIKYHLADASGIQEYTDPRTGKKKTRVNAGAIHNKDDLEHNIVEYVRHVSQALEKQGKSKTEIENILQEISQRGTVGGQWGDIYVNLAAIDKEEERNKHILARTTDNPDPIGKYLSENPLARTQQFSAAMEKLFAAFSGPLMDPVLAMMGSLTRDLNSLSNWAHDNPISAGAIASVIAAGTAVAGAVAAISMAMMIYGPILGYLKGKGVQTPVMPSAPGPLPAGSATKIGPLGLLGLVMTAKAAWDTGVDVYHGAIPLVHALNPAAGDDAPFSLFNKNTWDDPNSGLLWAQPKGDPERLRQQYGLPSSVAPRPDDLGPRSDNTNGVQRVYVTNPNDLARGSVGYLANQANKPDSGTSGFDGMGSVQPSPNTGLQ